MEQQSEIHLARVEALRGNVETALPILVQRAEAGDDGAAASAAELSAYLWRWHDVIGQAARLIANPYAVYAGNVFDELVLLLGRAGHETGDWRAIASVADAASQRVEADLQANPWGFPKTKIEGAQRLLLILNQLGEYALGEGRIRLHGDWNIFRPRPEIPKPDLFDAAMKSKWNRGCSPERRFAFASMYHLDDEMIRLFDMFDGKIRFDHAVSVAKAFLRRGDEASAWQAVRANWADWGPVDRAQTAPLVLLIDEGFAGLVARDRAMELVHIPRAAYLTT
jgi:hypothetical protein